MMKTMSMGALILGSTMLTPVPVHAQASVQPGSGPEAEAENDAEIIVTAQKIEQRAVDVPITISAVSGKRIAELGVSDLDELSNYIPGLNIQEQSANNPGIVIRGITSDSGSAQQGPRVTLYYNGVDISRSRGSYQAIYDLERVEVIKGPQATLFGTAAAVGAISITSARPRPGFASAVTAGFGNYGQTLLSGYLNGGSETLAARVAFETRTRDGYVRNLSQFQDDLYAQDQFGIRGSVRWRPAPGTTVDLIGTYDRQRNSGTPFISGTFATASGPADPFGDANLDSSPFAQAVLGNDELGLTRDVYDVNLTATFALGNGLSFTTVNGYRKFDSLEVFDADGSAAFYLEFAELAQGKQASHEGRFAYGSDRLRASAGWNYFQEKGVQNVPFSSEEGTFLQCAARLIPTLPCVDANGVPTAAGATALLTGGLLRQVPYSSVFENQGRNRSGSLFADATVIPFEALELTAGVRYLREKRRSGFFARVPRPLLNPTAFSLIPGQTDTGGKTFEASRSFDAWLPRFNILYRVTDRINVFGTVSKGRRSPVVQLNAIRVAGLPTPNLQIVPEENVWNYEVGVKGSAGIVSGTLGLFKQKYDGFQVSVVQPNGTTLTQSAGTATNNGVEAEVSIRPASIFNLFANVAYLDGGIDKDARFASTFSGARFRLQPEWQAAGGFTLDVPFGNGARAFITPTATYRSQIFFELPNNPRISQPGVTLVNVRGGLSFQDDQFEIAGFIRNATDKNYLLDAGNTGGAFGIATFIPGEPRFYGLQLTARFR